MLGRIALVTGNNDIAVGVVCNFRTGNYVIELAVVRTDLSEAIEASLILTCQKRQQISAAREEIDCIDIDSSVWLNLRNDTWYLNRKKDSNQVAFP